MQNNDVVFYKENPTDEIWWVDTFEQDGVMEFSFDKKKIYNLFRDYPHNLSIKEKALFDIENPFWADYFKDRASI